MISIGLWDFNVRCGRCLTLWQGLCGLWKLPLRSRGSGQAHHSSGQMGHEYPKTWIGFDVQEMFIFTWNYCLFIVKAMASCGFPMKKNPLFRSPDHLRQLPSFTGADLACAVADTWLKPLGFLHPVGRCSTLIAYPPANT